MEDETKTDRPLPAGWGWRTRREEDDPYPLRVLVSEQASAREWIAEAHGDGRWFVHESESEDATAEIAKGRATPRPGESLSAAAQREAVAALWARDGFGVGRVYRARLPFALADAVGAMARGSAVPIPGLPGTWELWVVQGKDGEENVAVDAVRAPFDTQAEADAALPWNWCPTCKQHIDIDDDTHEGSRVRCLGCRAWYVVCRDGDGAWFLESEAEHDADDARGTAKDAPPLTHALDAEGNALCPYDPATLAYVSQRPERVTCPRCREATAEPAPREPSAPDELARLLPRLPEDARSHLIQLGPNAETTRAWRLARACELLLAERERMARDAREHATLHNLALGREGAKLAEIGELRARVAELEAHEPAGHRVAALLRAVEDAAKDAVEETDDRPDHVRTGRPFAYVEGLREAARLIREHIGAPLPEDFTKLPRLSDAEVQAALDKGRAEAFPAHHPFAAHLTAPSPLDLAVAEVVASPLSDHAAIEISGADDAIEVIGELHAEREADTDRSLLLSIARVALAGMLACDAKGGPK